jgi:hypothetical protein
MAATATTYPVHDTLRKVLWMAREEKPDAPATWRDKLRWWPRGFTAESAAIYGLSDGVLAEYVNDYERRHIFRNINPIPALFDHKLLMRIALLQAGFPQAETVAVVRPETIDLFPFGDAARTVTPDGLHQVLLEDGGPFVIKPESSTQGRGVALIERVGRELVERRGHDIRPARLRRSDSVTLIERVLEQGEFWNRLNPTSANSIRLVTMWTPGDAEPFIGMAAQRIGTSGTAPTDNFTGGGICAPVDIESGRMGAGRRRSDRGSRMRATYSVHPDTGVPIEGEVIPGWERICNTVLRATRAVPFVRYSGWDVLVDERDTPVIIEANNNTGVDLFQVHAGVLRDPRVRRFYQAVGVR